MLIFLPFSLSFFLSLSLSLSLSDCAEWSEEDEIPTSIVPSTAAEDDMKTKLSELLTNIDFFSITFFAAFKENGVANFVQLLLQDYELLLWTPAQEMQFFRQPKLHC